MSLIILTRPRQVVLPLLKRKLSSSDSHAHDHHTEDGTFYQPEGFSSSAWRNGTLFSLLVIGFYKFAPSPGNEVSLTRWMARNSTPRDVWERVNVKHLALSQDVSEANLLTNGAQRPKTHRFRYPQSFEQSSPHLQPVGSLVDLSGLVVKADKE